MPQSFSAISGSKTLDVPTNPATNGVREALRAGRLIEVLPGYRAEPLSLSLVYPQRRELSRRVNLFMQWLAGVMKEHLD